MKNVAYADSMRVPASGSLATILLADDEPAIREFVAAVLQQQGYEVLIAENGRRSLELCKNYDGIIHLLITDVVMPEMNGRELAERAKVIRPDLKVLFMSGYVDRALKEEDTSNPSYAFLEKPFSAETLQECVAGICPAIARHAR